MPLAWQPTTIRRYMSIKYSSAFNNKIYSVVRNYNKRRTRMEKRGFKQLPAPAKVSELKSRYTVRSDLINELNRLKNLGRGDILTKVENEGGARSVAWEFDYLKTNSKNAKEYFQREYERVSKRVGRFPGERTYLDTISAKIDLLDKNINYMNQSDFRSAVTAINEFATSPTRRKEQYRGFLSEVEWVMEKTGYSKDERDAFFNKFSKLTPSQFLYAYDNNDIIAKIYNLYHKDYGESEAHLTSNEDDAKASIEELIEQADEIILDAKANMD